MTKENLVNNGPVVVALAVLFVWSCQDAWGIAKNMICK